MKVYGGLTVDADLNVDRINENTVGHNIVEANIVEKTAQTAFHAYMNTAITDLAVDVTTTLPFDTEVFDVGSNFNTGTYTFTAPVAGTYFFTARIRLDQVDTAASYYYLAIATNPAAYCIWNPKFTADLDYNTLQVSTIVQLAAAGTAYCVVRQHNGTAQTDTVTGSAYTEFSGYLLG